MISMIKIQKTKSKTWTVQNWDLILYWIGVNTIIIIFKVYQSQSIQQASRWNRMVTNFILNNNRKKVKLKTLVKSKDWSWLAPPDLQNYFNFTGQHNNEMVQWQNWSEGLLYSKRIGSNVNKNTALYWWERHCTAEWQNRWINNILHNWPKKCCKVRSIFVNCILFV